MNPIKITLNLSKQHSAFLTDPAQFALAEYILSENLDKNALLMVKSYENSSDEVVIDVGVPSKSLVNPIVENLVRSAWRQIRKMIEYLVPFSEDHEEIFFSLYSPRIE